MNLRLRLTGVFALILLMLFLAQLFLFEQITTSHQKALEIRESANRMQHLVDSLSDDYFKLNDDWKSVLLRGHVDRRYHEHLASFYKHERRVRSSLLKLMELKAHDSDFQINLSRLQQALLKTGATYREAIQLFLETDDDPHIVADQFVGENTEIYALIDNLRKRVRQIQSANLGALEQANLQRINWVVVASLVGGGLLLALLFLFIDRRIAKPIGKLQHAAERIIAGDHQARVEVQSGRDELTVLSTAFNRMLDEMKTKDAALYEATQQVAKTEKMAALGGVVAGVAHELNTPVGVSLTAATTLMQNTQSLQEKIRQDELKRSDLERFMETTHSAMDLIERNCYRAHQLLSSFRQVAVDQTSEQRRQFNLNQVTQEVLATLSPKLKKLPYTIDVQIPESLKLDSYPGPYGQVITNLVNNSLIHGFENRDQGQIVISAEASIGGEIQISYSDNGVGIPEAFRNRVFEPFFTTKKEQGGSGLGLNIVASIVTDHLGGELELESKSGEGTKFTLRLPLLAPSPGSRAS